MSKKLIELSKTHFENIAKEREEDCLKPFLENFSTKYTYDSVSFEGKNRMPFEDVKRLLRNEEILHHSEREKKEVLNHQAAFKYIFSMINEKTLMTEEKIKDLHVILLKDIMNGGIYRNVNIQIPGAPHQPPDYIKVYDRMKRLFDYVEEFKGSAIEKAVYIHATIAKIHPFVDGNGRIARLILNYYLIMEGYLPISIPLDLRDEYFYQLEIFKHEKKIEPIVLFFEDLILEQYTKVLQDFDITGN